MTTRDECYRHIQWSLPYLLWYQRQKAASVKSWPSQTPPQLADKKFPHSRALFTPSEAGYFCVTGKCVLVAATLQRRQCKFYNVKSCLCSLDGPHFKFQSLRVGWINEKGKLFCLQLRDRDFSNFTLGGMWKKLTAQTKTCIPQTLFLQSICSISKYTQPFWYYTPCVVAVTEINSKRLQYLLNNISL